MNTQLTPISQILVFLINVTGISLIITVSIEKIRPVLKRIFVLMTLFIFIWVDLAFFARMVGQTDRALLLIKIAWSITPLLFVLVYSFIINFLEKSKKYRVLTIVSYVVGILFLLITLFSRLVIEDTLFKDGILNIVYGPLIWLFFGTVGVYTAINFYLLIKYFRDRKVLKETKSKLKFLIVGLSIFFVANAIFNIVCPLFFNAFHLYEFGDYTTIVFITLIAYAIVRHQFFDVKILGASFMVSFLGSFLLLDTLIFSDTWSQRAIKIFVLFLYIPFGVLLIRSVMVEVKQREKLQELTKKLKELDKQKNEFISMAAHELRAPITAIKGYISMIAEGDAGDIPEKARGYLTDANAVNERLIRLVNNMLNVSRIEEGRLVYQMDVINLSRIVKQTYDTFKFEALRKELKFTLNIPDDIRDKVYVDSDRINEIVGNLVSNAVKFTEKGSISINMSQPKKSIVRVEIVDTGPGISEEEQQKLFRKFYRAESSAGKTIGTGLGLYISKLLVETFKGKIGLISKFGEGCTFWFELPLSTKEKNSKIEE